MADFRTFPSERGKDELAFKGYLYLNDRYYLSYSTWRCENSRSTTKNCHGRARLKNGVVEVLKEHNHFPSPTYVVAAIAKVRFFVFEILIHHIFSRICTHLLQ